MLSINESNRIEFFNVIGAYHYGDIQMFTNIVYNCAIKNRFKAKIHYERQGIGIQIHKIFDYGNYVERIGKLKSLPYKFHFGNILNLGKHSKEYWCNLPFGHCSCELEPLDNFTLPDCKILKIKSENYKCFQLDGHSPYIDKPRLSNTEIQRAIEIFHENKSYAIGNYGTKKYVKNMPVHFSNLIDQTKFILQCKSFFGIDSGMSHLCGTLKIDGDIVIQAVVEKLSDSVKKAYEFMYPTFRMHNRFILSKKCDIKIL